MNAAQFSGNQADKIMITAKAIMPGEWLNGAISVATETTGYRVGHPNGAAGQHQERHYSVVDYKIAPMRLQDLIRPGKCRYVPGHFTHESYFKFCTRTAFRIASYEADRSLSTNDPSYPELEK